MYTALAVPIPKQGSGRGSRPSAPQKRPTSILETRALRRVSRLEPGEVEHRRNDRRALQTYVHRAGVIAPSGG